MRDHMACDISLFLKSEAEVKAFERESADGNAVERRSAREIAKKARARLAVRAPVNHQQHAYA